MTKNMNYKTEKHSKAFNINNNFKMKKIKI